MANRNSKPATQEASSSEDECPRPMPQRRNPLYQPRTTASTPQNDMARSDSGHSSDGPRPILPADFVNIGPDGPTPRTSTPLSTRDREMQAETQRRQRELEIRLTHQVHQLNSLAHDMNLLDTRVITPEGQQMSVRAATHYIVHGNDIRRLDQYGVTVNLSDYMHTLLDVRGNNHGHATRNRVEDLHQNALRIHDHCHRASEKLDSLLERFQKMDRKMSQVSTYAKKAEQYSQVPAVAELQRRKRTHDNAFPAGKKNQQNNFLYKLAAKHGLSQQIEGNENVILRCPNCQFAFDGTDSENEDEDDTIIAPDTFDNPIERDDRNNDQDDNGNQGGGMIPVR